MTSGSNCPILGSIDRSPEALWEALMVGFVICQICKKPVVLETARINEYGKAVHEDCYLNSVKRVGPPPNTERPPEAGA